MSAGPIPILVISNHGDVVGGGEISLLALVTRLDRARWRPTVVVPHEGAVARRCERAGIRTAIVPLPGLRRPGVAALSSLVRLRRLCRQSGATLVHANGSRAMCYAAAIPSRLCRRLWHVRVADRDPWLDRILVRAADLIVVNSRAVLERFARLEPSRLRCVHNGVDLADFRPRPASPPLRRALGIPEGRPVAVSVGRFVPYKGYHDLVEAAALLQRELPEVHWVLVGEGELKAALITQVAARGLEKQVHFVGWRDDLPELLALGDVFVLPSHGEHFGRVLLEAMAMAKPVVATAAGGVPEIVTDGQTGTLVPAGSPPALAAATAALLRDEPAARRMGMAGRRRVEARFTIERHVREMEAAYAACLGAHGARV